ncbi:hypothetical protein LY90DRAFT_282222 [Neocallimastix californiae]|uniref:Ubiquitin-like domain-containing protein n=1 Tax=Neocallimastix californiae TaxID=1754190 RepID=A0A1Y2FF37_9FUNG|nr:hypothetical protein LY90DRAFT_282222 [Neocallimastix californiae]|eukprot:ORY82227.1 hypothetical protein LY90DRAFT_282222 [Neocallimastix californiae]
MSETCCIKVKRQKTIIFIEAYVTDNILTIKNKICKALRNEKEPSDIRLQLESHKFPNEQYSSLDDDATIGELGLSNNTILYMTYWISKDGEWEVVDVPKFEPAE